MRRSVVALFTSALVLAAGCSSESVQSHEALGSDSQYVVWLSSTDDLVSEHTIWHTKARFASGFDNQGAKFLAFHRDFLNRLRARHEAAGRALAERTPWETLSDDPVVYSLVPTSVRNAYNNLINNVDPSTGQPFATVDAFGTYLEEQFHNELHRIVGLAYPSDQAAITPVDMSPTSSFFFKIHGLVERMHQAFLRGKFNKTTYSDVVGVSVSHQGSVDVVDANLMQVSGATLVSSAFSGRSVTDPNCGTYVGAVADLNFDGSNDLIVHHPNCGRGEEVWQLEGVLPLSIVSPTWPAVSSAWRLIGSADFNKDLRPDLVWASNNNIRLWYMNGLTRSSTADVTLPTNFVAKAVGAMYNGANCIYARNTSTGENRAFCLTNTTTSFTFNLNTVTDQNWDIVGSGYYHSGPLNNKDVLWQNKSSGQGRLWLMNGAFSVSSTPNTNYGSTTLLLEGPR